MQFKPHDYSDLPLTSSRDSRTRRFFLDMGLGKTVITLTALDDLLFDSFEVSRVLVVCPLRVAKTTWPQEIAKWDHLRRLRYSVVVGTPKERIAALSRPAELYIINRENVEWLVRHYAGRKLPSICWSSTSCPRSRTAGRSGFWRSRRYSSSSPRGRADGHARAQRAGRLWPQIFLLDRGARLGRPMRSYLDMYFDTPTAGCPTSAS
jgi:hypothetical protein